MLKLKELREKWGYSQKQIAEMLDTTQQTIARWEAGKAEPSLAALRDLAVALNTTVDFLVGRKSILPNQTVDPLAWLKNDDSGFWGHVGLRLPQNALSMWYPVSTATMKEVYRAVQSDKWVSFQTLNNKMIIFRCSAVQSATFLDEADDGVCGEDWELTPDAVEGWSEEIYRCLDEFSLGEPSAAEGKFSERLIEVTAALIKKHDLDEAKLRDICDNTRIYGLDGMARSVVASPDKIAGVFITFDIDSDQPDSEMILLDDDYGERDLFFSIAQIALIEFPLLKLKEGLDEEMGKLET